MVSDDRIDSAIQRALVSPDIAAAMADPQKQLDQKFVEAALKRLIPELRSQLGTAEQELSTAQKELSDYNEERDKRLSDPPHLIYLSGGSGCLILIAAALGVLWFFNAALVSGYLYQTLLFGVPILYLLGGVLVASLIASGVAGGRWRRRRSEILASIESDPRYGSITTRVAAAEEGLGATIERFVTEAAFELIGAAGVPFHQNQLVTRQEGVAPPDGVKASSARGLSEVTSAGNEIITVERRDLVQLLPTLPGASIGVSGPRGSGKTTLLKSLTAGSVRIHKDEAVAIYTAAPVEYESRDFLLHVFATLCRRVLRRLNVAEEPADFEVKLDHASPLQGPTGAALRSALLAVGLVTTTMALLLALAMSPAAPGNTANASSSAKGLLTTIDAKPGPLLLFGIAALAFWVGTSLPGWISRLRTGWWFRWMVRAARPRGDGEGPARRVGASHPELEASTRRKLENIRFQRSFTAGWSGAIKVPVGFDLSTNATTSLAERQKSLPELVEEFSEYARQVADTYGGVIIAIDELDKMKSAADAERFINELKSIFNIEGCYFLISVSEDAMSSFERRGLALRDAFDSAFDEILYVGQMGLDGCRTMLARRVLDFPDPFLCICYVLSGGLPRDLIRVAREIFESVPPGAAPASLVGVGERILRNEAQSKLRASMAAVRNISVEPQTSDFISTISELQGLALGEESFRTKAASLSASRDDPADPTAAAALRLDEVRLELAAYLQFLDATLDLVRKMDSWTGWKQATEGGEVDRLASIRRAFELNVAAASKRLKTLPA